MNLRRHASRNDDPEITVVTFIDVLLLLLIFFMVSTTFVDEARLKVRLPEASVTRERVTMRDPIEITITRQGSYSVNGRSLVNSGPQTLSAAITQVALDARDTPITIRADEQATHQSVVTAMDVVGRLGFQTINLATVNEGAGTTPGTGP